MIFLILFLRNVCSEKFPTSLPPLTFAWSPHNRTRHQSALQFLYNSTAATLSLYSNVDITGPRRLCTMPLQPNIADEVLLFPDSSREKHTLVKSCYYLPDISRQSEITVKVMGLLSINQFDGCASSLGDVASSNVMTNLLTHVDDIYIWLHDFLWCWYTNGFDNGELNKNEGPRLTSLLAILYPSIPWRRTSRDPLPLWSQISTLSDNVPWI